jgi:hypothetical protein
MIGLHVGPSCGLPVSALRAVGQAEAAVASAWWDAELTRVDCWRGNVARLNADHGGYGLHVRVAVTRTPFHAARLYEDGSGWLRAAGGVTYRVDVRA